MASGFVYLRALRVGSIGIAGPVDVGAPAAWGQMCDWLDARGVRHEVKVGYGLCWHDVGNQAGPVRYEASIELPASIGEHEARELTFQKLPGGAYARERFTGGLDGMAATLASMKSDCLAQRGLVCDPHRPVITAFLDTTRLGHTDNLRVDILVPVAAAHVGRSAA